MTCSNVRLTPIRADFWAPSQVLIYAARAGDNRTRLNEIKGMVPSLFNLPRGCSFAPRCALASEQCRTTVPALEQHRSNHWVACWHAGEM